MGLESPSEWKVRKGKLSEGRQIGFSTSYLDFQRTLLMAFMLGFILKQNVKIQPMLWGELRRQ